jgi:hypothetical protein
MYTVRAIPQEVPSFSSLAPLRLALRPQGSKRTAFRRIDRFAQFWKEPKFESRQSGKIGRACGVEGDPGVANPGSRCGVGIGVNGGPGGLGGAGAAGGVGVFVGGSGGVGGGVGSARGSGVPSGPGGLGDLSGEVSGSFGAGPNRISLGKFLGNPDGPLNRLALSGIGGKPDRQGLHPACASSSECDLSPECPTSEAIFADDLGHRVTSGLSRIRSNFSSLSQASRT